MVKHLEIRRHTENDGDILTEEGVRDAVTIGRERLEGPYDLIVSSGAQRATQAAGCMLAGLGEPVGGGLVVVPGVRSEREDEWRDAYQQAGSGDLKAFREVAPAFVAEESRALGGALRGILDRLDDGQRALVVGHSPTNEAGVLGLTGQTIASMGKGDGAVVTLDGENTTLTSAR